MYSFTELVQSFGDINKSEKIFDEIGRDVESAYIELENRNISVQDYMYLSPTSFLDLLFKICEIRFKKKIFDKPSVNTNLDNKYENLLVQNNSQAAKIQSLNTTIEELKKVSTPEEKLIADDEKSTNVLKLLKNDSLVLLDKFDSILKDLSKILITDDQKYKELVERFNTDFYELKDSFIQKYPTDTRNPTENLPKDYNNIPSNMSYTQVQKLIDSNENLEQQIEQLNLKNLEVEKELVKLYEENSLKNEMYVKELASSVDSYIREKKISITSEGNETVVLEFISGLINMLYQYTR